MLRKIIIAGSGPVGSFMAALCSLLGFVVVVYEKREDFTRKINLKLESSFFKDVHEVLMRLNVASNFFEEFHSLLCQQNHRILIKDLETKFSSCAKAHGAVYITKNVQSFSELYEDHKLSNPIILDCTGRNSVIRINEFGSDDENIVSLPLQNAMHINFKARIEGNLSLYQVMKYIKHVKLSDVVVGRTTDENGFSNVTIPVFISSELAKAFDDEFPDINRSPLNPFNTTRQVSDMLFYPIAAILGNLLVDGCQIDFGSVAVKKIVISCGYAKKRSMENFVCLGDSAVHLAFFRSLNLGLKHALQLFVRISMIHEGNYDDSKVLDEFKRDNQHLHPIKFYPTAAKNVFMIVTKVVFYGCFSYCRTNRTTERLTNVVGVTENQIEKILEELNRKMRSWSWLMIEYETIRDRDIDHEMKSNKDKNILFDQASWWIGLNGKSFIKVSEVSRLASGKHALFLGSFNFMVRCLNLRKTRLYGHEKPGSDEAMTSLCRELLVLSEHSGFWLMKDICARLDIAEDERLKQMENAVTFYRAGKLVNFEASFILKLIHNELPFHIKRVNDDDAKWFIDFE